MPEWTSEISAALTRPCAMHGVAEIIYADLRAPASSRWQRDESQVIRHSCYGGLRESCARPSPSLSGPFSRQPALVPKGPKRGSGPGRALARVRSRTRAEGPATRGADAKYGEHARTLPREAGNIATVIAAWEQCARARTRGRTAR